MLPYVHKDYRDYYGRRAQDGFSTATQILNSDTCQCTFAYIHDYTGWAYVVQLGDATTTTTTATKQQQHSQTWERLPVCFPSCILPLILRWWGASQRKAACVLCNSVFQKLWWICCCSGRGAEVGGGGGGGGGGRGGCKLNKPRWQKFKSQNSWPVSGAY